MPSKRCHGKSNCWKNNGKIAKSQLFFSPLSSFLPSFLSSFLSFPIFLSLSLSLFLLPNNNNNNNNSNNNNNNNSNNNTFHTNRNNLVNWIATRVCPVFDAPRAIPTSARIPAIPPLFHPGSQFHVYIQIHPSVTLATPIASHSCFDRSDSFQLFAPIYFPPVFPPPPVSAFGWNTERKIKLR